MFCFFIVQTLVLRLDISRKRNRLIRSRISSLGSEIIVFQVERSFESSSTSVSSISSSSGSASSASESATSASVSSGSSPSVAAHRDPVTTPRSTRIVRISARAKQQVSLHFVQGLHCPVERSSDLLDRKRCPIVALNRAVRRHSTLRAMRKSNVRRRAVTTIVAVTQSQLSLRQPGANSSRE